MVSMRNKKNFSSNDTFFTSDQSHFLPKMRENVMLTSLQLVELVEMLKQQKTMLEEHPKLIVNLRTKKDDAQNEHLNVIEDEGNQDYHTNELLLRLCVMHFCNH